MLRKSILVAALAALAFGSTHARAVQPIAAPMGLVANATQLGAFAVAPYVTSTAGGGDLMTAVVVTNALSTAVYVDMLFVDGETNGNWDAPSLNACLLTPRETTVFRFTPQGTGTVVDGECSNAVFDPSQTAFPQLNGLNTPFQTVLDNSQMGFLGLLVSNATAGCTGLPNAPCAKLGTTNANLANAIVVDWTVADYAAGAAYSAEAHHFQVADLVLDQGFDRIFNTGIPIASATNLILPDCENRLDASTCDVDVEFILVPLDGRIKEKPPQQVNLDVWNNDEDNVDRNHMYECFDILRLAEVDSRFLADTQCPIVNGFDTAAAGCVGHVELTNLPTQAGLLHDTLSGDGNLVRNSATIAWVVQRFRPDNGLATRPNGEILNYQGLAGTGIANQAATARIFVSGIDPVVMTAGDVQAVNNNGAVLHLTGVLDIGF